MIEQETRKINLNGYVLLMYTSTEHFPIHQFVAFNDFVLLEAGFPTDLNSINERFSIQMKYNASGTKEDRQKLHTELYNMQQSVINTTQRINYKMLSFIPFIKRIDKQSFFSKIEPSEKSNIDSYTDFSVESANELLMKLSKAGLTVKIVNAFLERIKKKIELEFATYFPELNNGDGEYQFTQVKKLNRELFKSIMGQNTNEQIKAIHDVLFGLYKPLTLAGKDGALFNYTKYMNESFFAINQHSNTKAKDMTVFEYFSELKNLQKKFKPLKS